MLSAGAEAGPFVLHVCDDAACDGGNDITVESAGGIVSYHYFDFLGGPPPPFPGWSRIDVIGFSSDMLGTIEAPWVRLQFDARGRGADAAELFLSISDTDFTFNGGVHTFILDSVVPGDLRVHSSAYAGPSNQLFDTTDLLDTTRENRVGADGNPYSLTLNVNFGYADSRGIHANGTLEVVPEPASLALMGTGLATLALVRRRRSARR